jgi:hypothetical protein
MFQPIQRARPEFLRRDNYVSFITEARPVQPLEQNSRLIADFVA